MAYLEPQRQAETERDFKIGVYDTLRTMSSAENKPREIRIMQIQTNIDWSLVSGSLHNVRLSDGVRSAWYTVVHDVIPTNVRLHKIRLMDTDNCTQCERQDTTLHRLTECGVRKEIWDCTLTRKGRIRSTDSSCIPTEGLLSPGFRLWPRQRQQAILWFLGNMIF